MNQTHHEDKQRTVSPPPAQRPAARFSNLLRSEDVNVLNA